MPHPRTLYAQRILQSLTLIQTHKENREYVFSETAYELSTALRLCAESKISKEDVIDILHAYSLISQEFDVL